MKSSERKVLLNQIKRLEGELAHEKEENRILKQHVNNIENYRLEYEKLIAEVKEELQAVKSLKQISRGYPRKKGIANKPPI